MQRNEIDVLKEAKAELARCQKRLDALINNLKTTKPEHVPTGLRTALKRAAIDTKNALSKITTSTGTDGIYYYK